MIDRERDRKFIIHTLLDVMRDSEDAALRAKSHAMLIKCLPAPLKPDGSTVTTWEARDYMPGRWGEL